MGATATLASATAVPAAIHNILFASDFSSISKLLLPIAVAFARQCGVRR